MTKILSTKHAIQFAKKLQQQSKTIVLAGGCFDILHTGHLEFLEAAKKHGDVLFILLENDAQITKNKGQDRPINDQKTRADVLGSLRSVDFVVLLPEEATDSFYDELVIHLKPAIIATTKGDPNRHHKERQAKAINAKVVDVISPIKNQSTTKFASLLQKRP